MTLSLLLLVIAALVMSFQCWAQSQKCSKQHVLIYRSIKPCWPAAALPNQASCSVHLPWGLKCCIFSGAGISSLLWVGIGILGAIWSRSCGVLAPDALQARARWLSSCGLVPSLWAPAMPIYGYKLHPRAGKQTPLCWEKCIFIYVALSSCLGVSKSWNCAGQILIGCTWDWVYAVRAGVF